MKRLINVAEHGRHALDSSIDLAGLNAYLNEVWRNRQAWWPGTEDATTPGTAQPLLQVGYDAHRQPFLRAGQYVGFVQFGDTTIQIVPKLFGVENSGRAFQHLCWWLAHCRRIHFPFADVAADAAPLDDFPEALRYYFAETVGRLVNEQPYHQYEEQTATLTSPRGRLNTARYVQESLGRGRWHQLVCDHEPLVFNNRLNQLIKHVARSLRPTCRRPDTARRLDALLFTLDEVDDVAATARDCDAVRLSRFYAPYQHALDLCRFFLTHSYVAPAPADPRHVCFLLPMDYVFEAFIFGVMEETLGHSVRIKAQAQETLTREGAFTLRSDALLTYPSGQRVVADTKYKRRDTADPKAGIAQPDLYQQISYALRFRATDVVLLYPLQYGQAVTDVKTFHVESALLQPGRTLRIRAADLTVTGNSREAMLHPLRQQLRTLFTNQP